ncbi:two-component sensor histidine kinase [Rhizocola hellebori]|uniref:histidine kinase n=1 Tax=Rhizocola hellebori TaxID=1392758 RepID=A0A8J3VKV6_9ACTN|nr:sensor histidine kinase [Rhizocola hellebori]GIH09431.1 two-component sensor histidine kinase [Rhizocola hellebori]
MNPVLGRLVRLPLWAQDTALAIFVALMQWQGTKQVATHRGEVFDPGQTVFPAVVLLGGGLLLAVRRRWPVATFVVIGGMSVCYYAAGYPDGPGWVAFFVAAYTLTAYGDGVRSMRIAVGGLAALTVGWILTADISEGGQMGWLMFRIGTAIMATILGESVRMRRVLAAQAQERAERAERTREEEARRRVDAERMRIAREVHDTVAHAIAIINVQAGVTAHVLDRRPEQARETLTTIERTSARALHELRATLGVLTDGSDDSKAPVPGMAQVNDLVRMAREAGLSVSVELSPEGSQDLPSALDSAAYRILQESLTNVIRHAGPGVTVRASVERSEDELVVEVSDDGLGSPCPEVGSGRGIVGMRERCELLGGSLTAGPRPGNGFEVLARIPVRAGLAPAR